MIGTGSEGKEVILITLRRPLIYIQPMAVDKAILVWLNYKNAYEYWNEQRSSLNKEVLTATQQVFERVPFERLTSPPILGTLFLQLTVDDMGICIPLNPLPPVSYYCFLLYSYNVRVLFYTLCSVFYPNSSQHGVVTCLQKILVLLLW